MTGSVYIAGIGECPAVDLTDDQWDTIPPVCRDAAACNFDVRYDPDGIEPGIGLLWLMIGDEAYVRGRTRDVALWLMGWRSGVIHAAATVRAAASAGG